MSVKDKSTCYDGDSHQDNHTVVKALNEHNIRYDERNKRLRN